MLRLGTWAEAQDIKRMALAFFAASPYEPLGVDETRVEELIAGFLNGEREKKLVLLWIEDNRPVGVLAALADKNLFNEKYYAGEIIWWIDPEYRKTRAADKMRSAYEYWAKHIGCQSCTLVDLMGNLDTYYKRKGYDRRETAYMKVF